MNAAADSKLHSVLFGKKQIKFRLKRAKRRTLAITVHPDTTVVVAAASGVSVKIVKAKVRKRAAWIQRQQAFFQRFLPSEPPRRYVSGETHRYLGRQYRLKVLETADNAVKLKGRFIHVHTRCKADTGRIKELLEEWYLTHARKAFDRSFALCLARLNGHLVQKPCLRLRRMPKRWGSCTQRGVIHLNPELIKAPGSCIDYVMTHELCHLVHSHHGRDFFRLLGKMMPDWEQRKVGLERVLID